MFSDAHSERRRNSLSLLLIGLAILLLLLGGAVGVVWLQGPRRVVVNVTAPAGETVVGHFVVDGSPRAANATVPARFEFIAHDVRFALILREAAAGPLTVGIRDDSGSGGEATGDGIKGSCVFQPLQSRLEFGPMRTTESEAMRRAVGPAATPGE